MRGFADVYRGRRVLVTGHTGFKGSWLALWLNELGARVTGIALAPPTTPNHWDLLKLEIADHRADVRDAESVRRIALESKPEVVFHLAAQSLVRCSYHDPINTWSTNVVGTANILEGCRATGTVRSIVVVTSDKCYENRGLGRGYRETDALGGHDPYSASKAAQELVVSIYRHSFFNEPDTPLVATARAGNVIGGGDWGEDRLIPDLVRARTGGRSLAIRSPDATRPWQHVLESLNGYLHLGARLFERERGCASAWNFGPNPADNCTVTQVIEILRVHWPQLRWHHAKIDDLHEAQTLYLDSTKSRKSLGWRPVWSLDEALSATASWYERFLADGSVQSRHQLAEYVATIPAPGPACVTR